MQLWILIVTTELFGMPGRSFLLRLCFGWKQSKLVLACCW